MINPGNINTNNIIQTEIYIYVFNKIYLYMCVYILIHALWNSYQF